MKPETKELLYIGGAIVVGGILYAVYHHRATAAPEDSAGAGGGLSLSLPPIGAKSGIGSFDLANLFSQLFPASDEAGAGSVPAPVVALNPAPVGASVDGGGSGAAAATVASEPVNSAGYSVNGGASLGGAVGTVPGSGAVYVSSGDGGTATQQRDLAQISVSAQ